LRVIPVLDILKGEVVHGVGGVRSKYRPIVSKVTKSSDPQPVAADLKEAFGFTEMYVADLDAIQGRGNNLDEVESISGLGYSIYLDEGLGGAGDMMPRLSRIDHVVIGTETLQSLRELRVACRLHDSVVVSLDYKGDELIARDRSLKGLGVRELVHTLTATGISEMIYLDLARLNATQGEFDEAERCVKLALDAAGPKPPDLFLGLMHRCYGYLRSRQGNGDEAVMHLEESLKILEQAHLPVEVGKTRLSLGTAYADRGEEGDRERAREQLLAAMSHLSQIGAQRYLARAEAQVEELGYQWHNSDALPGRDATGRQRS